MGQNWHIHVLQYKQASVLKSEAWDLVSIVDAVHAAKEEPVHLAAPDKLQQRLQIFTAAGLIEDPAIVGCEVNGCTDLRIKTVLGFEDLEFNVITSVLEGICQHQASDASTGNQYPDGL